MNQKTRGIILQTTNYSETSLVVKIYTEAGGMGTFIVSGVRTRNGRFKSNLFQPLSLVELVATGSPSGSMRRITDIQLAPPLSGIPGDIIKSSIAIFLAEVIYRSIREEEPNGVLYGFLHNSIQILDVSQGNCSRFHLCFMIQLTKYLGFYPQGTPGHGSWYFDLKEGIFTNTHPSHPALLEPEPALLLYRLMTTGFENYQSVEMTPASMKLLLQALVTYFEIHHTQGSSIRSHTVLEEVLH
jgi:DNA repair protein RecO (recombination protein O)